MSAVTTRMKTTEKVIAEVVAVKVVEVASVVLASTDNNFTLLRQAYHLARNHLGSLSIYLLTIRMLQPRNCRLLRSFLRLVPRIARPAHIPALGLVKLLMLPPLGLVKLLVLPPGLIKLLMLPLLGLVKLLMLLPLFPRLHFPWQPIVLKMCDLPPSILKLNTLLVLLNTSELLLHRLVKLRQSESILQRRLCLTAGVPRGLYLVPRKFARRPVVGQLHLAVAGLAI
ncbi:hypothetical protein OH76DRAFT_1485934 [Lentinus brumalis]|uniref:Uncharacterized protein n=1 Tax=Lentinus brumalis TaxID=2498619 RepID=A0A371D094_9APHY|nr:hypothetical protein OH76DRAFT_1485934 [Polyporus brumalis]